MRLTLDTVGKREWPRMIIVTTGKVHDVNVLGQSLYTILQILSVSLFEETAHFTGSERGNLPNRGGSDRQSIGIIQKLTGQ